MAQSAIETGTHNLLDDGFSKEDAKPKMDTV